MKKEEVKDNLEEVEETVEEEKEEEPLLDLFGFRRELKWNQNKRIIS